ncbi:MAG TPA: hypothetical protein VGQ81_01570 [Acidobacteriota bacterium]|jgi:hypothetical protein|nr:hypothetical protein [Acidobacteriota bacterium]
MRSAGGKVVQKFIPRFVIVLFLFHGAFGFAQIRKLTSPRDFSLDSMIIGFGEFLSIGDPGREAIELNLSDLYSKIGVTFTGEGGSVPTGRVITLALVIPPMFDGVIQNKPPGDSSAGLAFIIKLKSPARRVGFTLGNGTPRTVAEIRAFTAKGDLLGAVQQDNIDPKAGPFVGVETSNPLGISTVVVDYGNEPAAEQINDLRIDFLSPPVFKIHVPQIAHARIGNLLLQTELQIQTVLPVVLPEVQVRMRFFNQAGAPLPLTFDGKTQSVLEFTLGRGFGSRRLETSEPAGSFIVGYASIESNNPLLVHAIYKTLNADGSAFQEAGIEAREAFGFHLASVEWTPAVGLDTGVALVNAGAAETLVWLVLSDASGSGEKPKGVRNAATVTLKPGEQKAFSVRQLLATTQGVLEDPDFVNRDFQGSLIIVSKEPIAVTTVRMRNGIAVSSLPIGNAQQ